MVDGDPGSEREAAVDVGDGLQLHVSIEGRGPPLVLLHGFTGSVHSWDLVRPLLAGHHTTLAIDLPGHGRSGAPSTPASHALPRVADAIARVLDALRIEEAALHGYSLGGRAALHAALQHPSRITRLILESSSPGIADPAEREGRRSSDAALADRIERAGIGAFVEEWEALPLWASQRRLPREVRDGLRARRLANRPAGLAASLRGAGPGAQGPLHDRLPQLELPVLVVAGALDPRYVEIGQLMQREIPRAKLQVVEGAGHAVHLERPAALAEAVLDFLGVR